MSRVFVVCRYRPLECFSEASGTVETIDGSQESDALPQAIQTAKGIVLDEISKRNDEWDDFNHPRERRALILRELYLRGKSNGKGRTIIVFETPAAENMNENDDKSALGLYRKIHSDGLISFLSIAWKNWDSLGQLGRDPSCIPFAALLMEDSDDETQPRVPPLIPSNFVFPRDNNGFSHHHPQRSSKNVMGKMGYYCTDTCTPIFSELVEELAIDARTVARAVAIAIDPANSAVVYALCTHPGHHASHDSFGGYCYVNNAALAARLLQEKLSSKTNKMPKIVILDVDYHCGNGTASIFYDDPSILVVSIHCHPDSDYPFHSGFGDETGGVNAEGLTLHVPLPPGSTWHDEYQAALRETAGSAIANFQPDAFVLSLGLDTHAGDPCAIRRAGFRLSGSDYDCMGRLVGEIIVECSTNTTQVLPTIVLQEGGYKMDAVPSAAADVVLGMAASMGGGK